jgi:hypothetical protein
VTPKYEPHSGNAPGPFYVVRGECLACWAAVDQAPDMMHSGGSDLHCRFAHQPRTEEEISRAICAIAACCTHAIRYAGTEKTVLDRLSNASTSARCDILPESDGLDLPPNLS